MQRGPGAPRARLRLSAAALTAIGLSNAMGDGEASALAALRSGQATLRAPPFALPFSAPSGIVLGPLDPLPAQFRAYDTRVARLCLRALEQIAPAVRRARARFGADRVAVLVGSSTGGLDATEHAYRVYRDTHDRLEAFTLRRAHAFDALGVLAAAILDLQGPRYALSTACTSSAKAIASARRMIVHGVVDAAVVIGADALCETTLRGFHGLSVLSPEGARPFSALRNGTHLGEGAACLLLERGDNGPVLIGGVGESSDASSMAAPHPEGRGAIAAMQGALQDAGVGASDVSYVNAHGTGTEQNDRVEALAIASVLGRVVPVLSTKALTGHVLGASGATEIALSALCLMHGELPASAGAEPVDPALNIHVQLHHEHRVLKVALKNAFAFGGSNVSIVLVKT